ncbi:MAG: phytoene/squalene synthase family protein [Sporichthyaceae bacterium]
MSRRTLDAAGITDPELRASYLRCKDLHARHGRTYYLATLLLPPAQRPYVWALYGFARYADDLVDDLSDPATPAQKAERLTAWSRARLADLHAGASTDPIGRALVHTTTTWQIPTTHISAFLDSMRTDLTVTDYASFDDLLGYMEGSAAVIGLAMLPILRPRDPDDPATVEHARALGIAFQLTNFLRDVGEDLDRGRLYLPTQDLHAHGITRSDLERRIRTPQIEELMRFQIDRTRAWYAAARPGVELLHPSSRDCIRAATTLYSGILDELERAHLPMLTRRVSVPTTKRLRIAGPAYARSRRARSANAPRPAHQVHTIKVQRTSVNPKSRSSTGAHTTRHEPANTGSAPPNTASAS